MDGGNRRTILGCIQYLPKEAEVVNDNGCLDPVCSKMWEQPFLEAHFRLVDL